MCCGSRMFWFDKTDSRALFIDNRELDSILCDDRILSIHPDMLADFRDLPFEDETFYHVVFDPPHLLHAGEDSWLAKKYGVLEHDTWKDDIRTGFKEGMRVLKPFGTLIFKWSEHQISTAEIMSIIDVKPMYGFKRGKSIFLVFLKVE